MSSCPSTRKEDVTDRALRYRAHQCPPAGPKVCALCGSRRNVVIDHKDGFEEHSDPKNLRWLCKRCNTKLGAEMARKGQGRRTKQFNAGARTLAEYVDAADRHRRGHHDAGGKVIHETPRARRSSFAREIWRRRHEHSNPADVSAERFEEFHGFPSAEVLEVQTLVHVHENLWAIGDLEELVIVTESGYQVRLGGFNGAVLCGNEECNQMFVEGGDQAVDVTEFGIDGDTQHESEVLGRLKYAVYFTTKTHLGAQGGEADYKHHFGEENGTMPFVLYDTRNELIGFAGGSYTIPAEGIRN